MLPSIVTVSESPALSAPDALEDVDRHVREVGRLHRQDELEGDAFDMLDGMILREQPLSRDELRRIKLADGQVERDNIV